MIVLDPIPNGSRYCFGRGLTFEPLRRGEEEASGTAYKWPGKNVQTAHQAKPPPS